MEGAAPSRAAPVILGLALAAAGGVPAYGSFFVEPHAPVVNADRSVREVTYVTRPACGLLPLAAGAGLALFAARRRTRTPILGGILCLRNDSTIC